MTQQFTKSEKIIFKSSDGLSLTGEINKPSSPVVGTIALTHPHPLYGGNMYNNVIETLWSHLAGYGLLTFRFNFRGVGTSEGNFEEGIGETRDVDGALRFLMDSGYASHPCFLIGYSFGAYVIHRLNGLSDSIEGISMISPPVSMMPFVPERFYPCPHLIVAGNKDPFCRTQVLKKIISQSPENKTLLVIPGVDHFWLGREELLVEKFLAWAKTFIQ